MNRLYYGDCLTVLEEMPSGVVDLIYLDPPFNSNRGYNAIYKTETGQELPDQIDAFCDMWELDDETQRGLSHMPVLMRETGMDDDVAELWRLWMNALRYTQPRLLAYLYYMTIRLVQMKRVLSPAGSIYYHCDPTASHYIKAIMDAIFRHENFRNEIIWQRTSAHSSARRYGPTHDTILFYTRSDRYAWSDPRVPHDQEYIDKAYRHEDDDGKYRLSDLTAAGVRNGASGQPWRDIDPTSIGRHWAVPGGTSDPELQGLSTQDKLDKLDERGRIYWPTDGEMPSYKRYWHQVDEGQSIQDVWSDIPPIGSNASERMGYPTQKPVALLERIIGASSVEGQTVLDPFCGCASTLEAAHNLGRKWIGIDIAIHAVKRVARLRLEDRLGLRQGEDFTIEGVPRNVEGARDLWERDRYHFQKWAVEQADGFVTTKRTADGGIDGRLYFAVPDDPALQSMVIEVKGGNPTIADVRSLRGVLEREDALMAGLIIMKELSPTKERNFKREMASAEPVELWGNEYPAMQMLTVQELLDGKRFQTPTVMGKHTESPRMPGLPA